MSDVNFPSGPWVGFYKYPHRGERFLMDLVLEFRDGAILGEGWDDIGLFDIDGRYSTGNLECSWKKMYYRKHTVLYAGYRDRTGIWGKWTIGPAKGDFHIWPIGQGAASATARAEANEVLPSSPVPSILVRGVSTGCSPFFDTMKVPRATSSDEWKPRRQCHSPAADMPPGRTTNFVQP